MPEEKENQKQASSNFFSRLLENLKTKRKWQFGALIVILVITIGYFYSTFEKSVETTKTSHVVKMENDKREIFKEKDLRRTGSENKSYQERSSESENVKPVKRNYATDIAAFIYQEKEKRDFGRAASRSETKKLGLPAGTKIPTLTAGTIFSFNVAAPVTLIVSKDIEKNGNVIIPKDSQFLGQAGVLKSLNRVNVNLDILIFPDGRQVRVRAMALSEDGSSGIKGRINKHRDTQLLKALGETVLGGAAIFTGGVSSQPYSLEDRLRENAFENLTGMARQDIRNVKTDVSITVDSFTPVQVILLEAV